MSRYSYERMIGIKAVQMAARVSRSIQSSQISKETLLKKDRSPVTVADFSSQAIISHFLKEAFPNARLAAEESASDLAQAGGKLIQRQVFKRVQSIVPTLYIDIILELLDWGQYEGGAEGRFWTLDPIDGTKGFLRGEQYTISLALIEDGEVVLGILGCPNYPHDGNNPNSPKGCLFVAERGDGASMRGLDESQERPIHVSNEENPNLAVFCESVDSEHTSHDMSKAILGRLGAQAPALRIDSQCKYAAVARGDASVYLRLPKKADYEENIWDHAAGAILVTEAGGKVTDIFGKALDFSVGRTLAKNKGAIVSNGHLQDRVIETIQNSGLSNSLFDVRYHFQDNP